MSDYRRTPDECAAEAAKLGRIVVYPKPNELQLDIDDEAQLEDFEERFGRVASLLAEHGAKGTDAIVRYRKTPSPSGRPGRWHVTVEMPRPVRNEGERVFLQALLGSDPMREGLGWRRYVCGDEHPTCFFENP
jgi:hypothetical protein